jgi:hypothetical protein
MIPRPDVEAVMHELSDWITHYNEVQPRKALKYHLPHELTAATRELLIIFGRSVATTSEGL